MLKNSLNCILQDISYSISNHINDKTLSTFINDLTLITAIQAKFNKKIYYNTLLHSPDRNQLTIKKPTFNSPSQDKLQKIILHINRTSVTLKSNRLYRYKLTTGIGVGNNWIGIGEGKNKLFKNSYLTSLESSKKHIYSLNFNCNDYQYLKYKGCKFKAINSSENRQNLKIYNNISKLSDHKKIKLISYGSKTPTNILKSLVRFF